MTSKTRTVPPLQRWLLVGPLLLGAACGGPQALGDTGATCFRDDDCVPGLICVAPTEDDVSRVCSNDPTPLISNVEGPPVMEPMGGAAGMGGAMAVAGGGMAGGGAANAGSAGSPVAGAAGSGGGGAGGTAGSGGTDTAGSAGTAAGTAGSAGSDPDGGAPN